MSILTKSFVVYNKLRSERLRSCLNDCSIHKCFPFPTERFLSTTAYDIIGNGLVTQLLYHACSIVINPFNASCSKLLLFEGSSGLTSHF